MNLKAKNLKNFKIPIDRNPPPSTIMSNLLQKGGLLRNEGGDVQE